MLPKTKQQVEIVKLNKKLPKITDAQIRWGYKKCFSHYVWKTKHKAVCFECGHKWDLKTTLITTLFPVVCPNCHKKLHDSESRSWTLRDEAYIDIMTLVGDYQVIRTIQLLQYCKKGEPATYYSHEIYQHWISGKGKHYVLSSSFNMLGGYGFGRGWCHYGGMELRKNSHDRYYISHNNLYPKVKIHPNIIRNGYSGELFGFSRPTFFWFLLTNPHFETLVKAGQRSIVSVFYAREKWINDNWSLVKMCFKHKYICDDFLMWVDYIELLRYFKMNIYDPLILLPDNIKVEHDRLLRMRHNIEERNRIERQKKKDNESKEFLEGKKKLFDLKFTDGKIDIIVLKTIAQFKKEEKTLEHCVYSSGYYKMNASLILSARLGKEILETIEVSLREFKVIQCRGYDNKSSKYHKQILKIMEKNIHKIKQEFYKPKIKKKPNKIKLVA